MILRCLCDVGHFNVGVAGFTFRARAGVGSGAAIIVIGVAARAGRGAGRGSLLLPFPEKVHQRRGILRIGLGLVRLQILLKCAAGIGESIGRQERGYSREKLRGNSWLALSGLGLSKEVNVSSIVSKNATSHKSRN